MDTNMSTWHSLFFLGRMVVFTGDNKPLEDIFLQGNRSLCEVTGVKLKDIANVVTKKYYDRKVRTVLAGQVEYLEQRKWTNQKR